MYVVSPILSLGPDWSLHLRVMSHAPTRPLTGRFPRAVAVGFVTGLFSGLFGVGGGPIVVPGMVYLLGMRQREAQGSSLVVIIPIALVGALIFSGSRAIDLLSALVLAIASMAGAVIGARLTQRLSAATLRQAFGVALLVIGGVMIGPAIAHALHWGLSFPGASRPGGWLFWTLGFGLGLATGVLSGLLGIGGGILLVPGMVLLLGLTQHAAEGTSLAVIIPTAFAGSLTYFRMGTIRFETTAILIAAGVVGAALGALASLLASEPTLRLLFAGYLIVTGLWMIGANQKRAGPPIQ